MPSGGDGFYYFSVYLAINAGSIIIVFDVEVNGELLCSPNSDLTSSPVSDRESVSCSGVTYVSEGRIFTYHWMIFRTRKNYLYS